MEKDVAAVISASNEDEVTRTLPRKEKKIWYEQQFNSKWLNELEFKDWLRPHESNRNFFMCMICDTKFKNPNGGALIKHTNSKKHNMNLSAKQNQFNISTLFKKSQDFQSMEEKAVTVVGGIYG